MTVSVSPSASVSLASTSVGDARCVFGRWCRLSSTATGRVVDRRDGDGDGGGVGDAGAVGDGVGEAVGAGEVRGRACR